MTINKSDGTSILHTKNLDIRTELLRYVAEGYLDKDDLLAMCLGYMSHSDVVEMMIMNEIDGILE
jgi:hypothetical protein